MILKGLQKTTLLDYPDKVACLVFTGGCNFRCPYCHNSELAVNPAAQPDLSEQELFSFLRRRVGLLDGVCITGGEPLLNADIAEFIEKIRALGYCVKVDTNGSFPERLQQLIERRLVDYVAMDVKSGPDGYARAAGVQVELEPIRRSIELLLRGEVEYEFRTTLANGLQSEQDIVQLSQLLSGARRLYLQRFVLSDFVPDRTLTPPDDEQLQRYRAICAEKIEFVGVR